MTVTNIERDAKRLTLAITAEFDASIDAVWQLWENPRQLEQWWGPPTLLAMGRDEGMASAMGQIPSILSAATGRGR